MIGFGATLQLNIVMDTSASMIVGATDADVTTISNWTSAKTIINEKCGSPLKKQNCYHWESERGLPERPGHRLPHQQESDVFRQRQRTVRLRLP